MRIRTVAYLSIAGLVHAAVAWGQEGTDELDQWIPSFGMSIGIVRQSGSAIQQNNLRPADDRLDPPEVPGTPSAGDDSLIDPLSVFTVELMTPGIGAVPLHPRLFAHGEVGGALGSSVRLAVEGTPNDFRFPPEFPNVAGIAIGGQGTKTELEVSTLMAGAGAGIAFTADLFDRRLRLKPSFEYLRHGVEAEGVVQHAISEVIPGTDPQQERIVNLISFHRQKERTLHSVGGGIELEMDTLRAGPFMIALFANGQAYRLLGDTDIRLFASDGTNTATWHVTLDREIYRGSVGLRFRFVSEE